MISCLAIRCFCAEPLRVLIYSELHSSAVQTSEVNFSILLYYNFCTVNLPLLSVIYIQF
jgi:hypothetical protein